MTTKPERRSLGRGLSALLGEVGETAVPIGNATGSPGPGAEGSAREAPREESRAAARSLSRRHRSSGCIQIPISPGATSPSPSWPSWPNRSASAASSSR